MTTPPGQGPQAPQGHQPSSYPPPLGHPSPQGHLPPHPPPQGGPPYPARSPGVGQPGGPPPPPGAPGAGWYPQEDYYAPGWSAPAGQRPRRRGGRALLVTLLALLALVVLGGAGAGAAWWWQTRELGEVTSPTTASTRQLEVGHCLAELPADGAVSRVRLVPCGDPHAAEVVGVLAVGTGDFPGRTQVEDRVARWCEMDSAQQESGFRAVALSPGEAAWGQGDREGVCLAAHPSGAVTGSFLDGDVVTP